MQQKNNEIKSFGYHISDIKKGVLGESSKILEETLELIDAEKQNCKVMCIVELSDMVGAIQAYLDKHQYKITIEDLVIMSKITKRAFESGHRK